MEIESNHWDKEDWHQFEAGFIEDEEEDEPVEDIVPEFNEEDEPVEDIVPEFDEKDEE